MTSRKTLLRMISELKKDIRQYQQINPLCIFDPSSEAYRLCEAKLRLQSLLRYAV